MIPGKSRKRILLILLLLTGIHLCTSCASLYFQHLPSPVDPLQFKSLKDFPYRELWSGFVFYGEKVGFSHLEITPWEGEQFFRISSEAHLRIRFMGLDKQVSVKSEDIVRPDLTLVSFHYEQKMDKKSWTIKGEIIGENFQAVVQTGGQTKSIEKKFEGPIYPASAINLYPLLKGLTVGSSYKFLVFDPQTQSFVEVAQQVMAFEKSKELQLEPAYKIETDMLGHRVSSWINRRGETIFELAMGGVLITHQEEEERAKRFLSETSLNKKDLILDFALVKTQVSLPCPRETTFLEVALEGVLEQLPILQGPGQEAFEQKRGRTNSAVYRLHFDRTSPPKAVGGPLDKADLHQYLAATVHLESDHPEIRKKAAKVTAGAASPMERVQGLTRWVSDEVKDEAVESFSALEVLHTRKGECQAHSMLYAAMARAVGIPTRIVGGIVYAGGLGFLYHSWAESYLDGWIAVDPTFNQVGVDATHIKLVEGPSWTSLIPLGKVVGRIKATVINFRAPCLTSSGISFLGRGIPEGHS